MHAETHAASAFYLPGGTDVAVTDGGTGASSPSDARTNLGLAIGSDVQAYDAGLASIAGLTTAADNLIYTTASDTYATATFTSFARTLLDDTDAATARTTLGVSIGSDVQAYDALLASIAGLTTTTGDLIYTSAADTAAVLNIGTAGQILKVSAGGLPEWGTVAGTGDMVAATYDPQNIAADAFERANHTGTQTLSTISDAGTAAAADTGDFATAAQGATADSAVQPSDLATVATSGDYDDLSNRPDIIVPVADRTALKALDTTTKKTAVIYGEAGSDGRFVFRSGDYSAHITADTLEAYFIKADGVAATSGAWVREDGQAVAGYRVDRFGAVADGDGAGSGTDYSAAAQAAIDLAAAIGGFVSVPYIGTGIYRWLDTVEMKSNVTVRVAPHVSFDNQGSSAAILVSLKGTVGSKFVMGGNRFRGDKNVVPLTPGSGGTYDGSISAGDLIHIVSQRNALSSDAGRWRCGNGTAGAPYAYFAEFHVVKDVTGTNNNVLGIQTGILFPSYRIDDSEESDGNALPAATIKKVTPCENAHWIGGRFLSTEDTNYLFQGEWAVDCTVQDVIALRGTRTGRTIRWVSSLRCKGINVRTWNDPTLSWDYSTYHGLLNRYMTAGTQDCGFIRCEDHFGGQSFDFSYSSGAPFVSVRTFMEECATYNSFEQGVTTHPGCFQTRVSDCRFIDCYEDGIVFRGLQDKAFNNTITANAEMNADGTGYASAGIAYYDGHAKGGRCEGNDIFGFRYAYYVNDGGSSEQYFTEIDLAIRGGTVQDCHYGLFTNLSASSTYYKSRKVSMDGVKGSDIGRYLMSLGNNMPGCAMVNCELAGPFTDTTANSKGLFFAGQNCPGQVVMNNRCYDMGSGASGSTFIVAIGNVTDTTNYPSATWANKTKIRDNFVIGGVDTAFSVNNTAYTQTDGTPS